MLPADIEPWVWIPLSRRRGLGLSTILVAVAAATAGYVMGHWHTNVAQPQKTIAAGPQLTNNSGAKPREVAQEPDLALKSVSDTEKRMPTLPQTKPEAPPVVLLNPGMGNAKVPLRDLATPRRSRAAAHRGDGNETPRSDVANSKPRDELPAAPHKSMRDYGDLRDYMLRR
jgi:hypothetical protein